MKNETRQKKCVRAGRGHAAGASWDLGVGKKQSMENEGLNISTRIDFKLIRIEKERSTLVIIE